MKTCRVLGPPSWQQDKQNEILTVKLTVVVMELVSAVTEKTEEGGWPDPHVDILMYSVYPIPSYTHVVLVVAREHRKQKFNWKWGSMMQFP